MAAKPNQLYLKDDDIGEITISLNGRELRGWSYKNDDERRAKMLAAREYVEGWYEGFNAGMDRVSTMIDQYMKVDGAGV